MTTITLSDEQARILTATLDYALQRMNDAIDDADDKMEADHLINVHESAKKVVDCVVSQVPAVPRIEVVHESRVTNMKEIIDALNTLPLDQQVRQLRFMLDSVDERAQRAFFFSKEFTQWSKEHKEDLQELYAQWGKRTK